MDVGVDLQINESCEHTYRMLHTFLAQETDTQWLGVSGGHKVTYTFSWTFGFSDAADLLNVYVGVDRKLKEQHLWRFIFSILDRLTTLSDCIFVFFFISFWSSFFFVLIVEGGVHCAKKWQLGENAVIHLRSNWIIIASYCSSSSSSSSRPASVDPGKKWETDPSLAIYRYLYLISIQCNLVVGIRTISLFYFVQLWVMAIALTINSR
jgi:hypothetical protein